MNLLDRMWSTTGAVLLALSLLALWVWPKFFGVEVHPIFGWAEALSGATWLEPGARWAVGAFALAAALLVLVPRTRLAAGWGALALSVIFLAAHLTPWLGVNIPDYEPLMNALAAGATAEQIQAMSLPTDKGAHFSLALLNALMAVITIGGEVAGKKGRRAKLPVGMYAASAA